MIVYYKHYSRGKLKKKQNNRHSQTFGFNLSAVYFAANVKCRHATPVAWQDQPTPTPAKETEQTWTLVLRGKALTSTI